MIKVRDVSFDDNTPNGVINAVLANLNQSIRVFYGDAETGRDWCEEYMTHGHVYLSRGRDQYPCFCDSKLYTANIVKIMANGRTIYKHQNYHQPEFTIGLPPCQDWRYGHGGGWLHPRCLLEWREYREFQVREESATVG